MELFYHHLGKTLRTETEGMVALIPVLQKETTTCSIMSYGYNPVISKWSPYHDLFMRLNLLRKLSQWVELSYNSFLFPEYFENYLIFQKNGKTICSITWYIVFNLK